MSYVIPFHEYGSQELMSVVDVVVGLKVIFNVAILSHPFDPMVWYVYDPVLV